MSHHDNTIFNAVSQFKTIELKVNYSIIINGFGDSPQVSFFKKGNAPQWHFLIFKKYHKFEISILYGFDIQNQCLLYAKTH